MLQHPFFIVVIFWIFLVFILNVFFDFWKRKNEFGEYPKMGYDKDDVLLFFILFFCFVFLFFYFWFDSIGLTLYTFFFNITPPINFSIYK